MKRRCFGLPGNLTVILSLFLMGLSQGCSSKVTIDPISLEENPNIVIPQGKTATVEWTAPTENSDGTPLTDLAGYKIYYGTSPGAYSASISTGNVTSYTVSGLSSGTTYYFAIAAVNTSGDESALSNAGSKRID